MGLFSNLFGSGDRQLAETKYAGRESASDRAARRRREGHRARVFRDGDNSGTRVPRRYRKHNG
jgi:hypothetical protein